MNQTVTNPIQIKKARAEDLPALLKLYEELHRGDPAPEDERAEFVWHSILSNPYYHILLAEAEGKIVASVTVVVIQNLTRSARPYAIIENVITTQTHRRQGIASALMAEAVNVARAAGCYKASLTTGNKDEGTFRFYESCGLNREDKTAFIRWLKEA
ncbi:MAG TPA: GNAT family N-acetyltransferase [Candidatus Limiplasma sp.]|nr:GNAT family N-acetyltransferase [Candidatus Limiplasma sp.]HRX09228.1 GNAT family N-acetyltransferase [Candidatus Limiplasma sp.]